MGYYINPAEMPRMFAVPASVADRFLKTASSTALRVLLWGLKNADKEFSPEAAAEALGFDIYDVRDALGFWADAGILLSADKENNTPIADNSRSSAISTNIKPDRGQAAKRGLECPEIAFLLRETEKKFGRMLRDTEIRTLVWLYDDQGLSSSLILMIVGFAVSEGRPNIGFIERTAVEWARDGVNDIESAESRLVTMRQKQSAWHTVERAMGIEHRSPSAAELDAADKWVNEWGYGFDILRAAYENCVDATSKFSIPYIKKIIASWHNAGVKTAEDLKNIKTEKSSVAASSTDYNGFLNDMIKRNQEV